ncbi:SHOCT domain-containing protein [Halomarina pelagica]|uniref:SHOCT domain-containing protein n=1 Tax=Halomarina pelagica TaxID=2961599 RepID=UPI0020C3019A|nr:SHOCT domain-containing protein [Halomarina sp. BND7]
MTTTFDSERIATLALLVLGALILLPALFAGVGMMGGGTPMMGWGYGRASGWMFTVGWIVQLLVPLALVGFAYLLYRAATGGPDRGAGGRDRVVEELRSAYARGDLTDDEFDRRRERLSREE